jgi:hypothetical protein
MLPDSRTIVGGLTAEREPYRPDLDADIIDLGEQRSFSA